MYETFWCTDPSGRHAFSSSKDTAAQLQLAKLRLSKTLDFWDNVLRIKQVEVEMCGHNVQLHIWRKPTINLRHGGRDMMIWTNFATTGPKGMSGQANANAKAKSCQQRTEGETERKVAVSSESQ
uniref:Uncharacterized protein n=1 Tax=Poecilia reticulata TaxID=8081 RepID=A0A3P9PJ79_POERE